MTKQKIRIDLARILETANVGIRRAAVFMGLGVNLASESTFKKYELTDEVNIQIVPSGANDDLVDATTLALARFRQGGFIKLPSDEEDDIPYFRSSGKRLYAV